MIYTSVCKLFCVLKGQGLELPNVVVPVFHSILPMETQPEGL